MQSKLGLSLLAAAMVGLSTVAYAVPVVGTASFSDNGPNGNGLLFEGSFSPSSLNLNLTPGTPLTISNYLTITSTDTNNAFFGSASATENIAVKFVFTQPGIGSGQITGIGQETTYSLLAVYGSTGLIDWGAPAVVNFGDGSQLSILLSDEAFSGSWRNPANDTVKVDATFSLTAAPVPEPASLALLGTGLLGLGVARRNSKRGKVAATKS